jgi:hypothetical protein
MQCRISVILKNQKTRAIGTPKFSIFNFQFIISLSSVAPRDASFALGPLASEGPYGIGQGLTIFHPCFAAAGTTQTYQVCATAERLAYFYGE